MSSQSSIIFIMVQVVHSSICAPTSYLEKIVFPELIEVRDISAEKVLKITEDLTLYLEKSSVLAKEFLLRTYDGRLMQHTYLDGESLEENLYHDLRSLSSVMVSQESGLKVEGVLGPRLTIRPSLEAARTADGHNAHILYEVADETESGSEAVFTHASSNVPDRQENKGDTVDLIRPELLICVDSTFASQFPDHKALLRYVIISVNSVNVRYLTVSEPAVRLRLCAVEVFTVYEESFLYKVNRFVASGKSLERLKDYVYNHYYKYEEYDVIYFITGLDMAAYKGYRWEDTQQGIAYVAGACTERKVALGEDRAMTYQGVRICAHELGHLFGCPHDGEKHTNFNSERCPWNDGFIMSYVQHNSRSLKFSWCCKNMIRQHASSAAGSCLRKQNTKRKIKKANFTSILAGETVGRDQFCKLTFPDAIGSYVLTGDVGKCHVCCYVPPDVDSRGYRKVFLPDNAWCNENNGTVCLNGDCVQEKLKYKEYQPTK
nr:venom metalloproteinase 3-like [Rhipicephalus microplus]